MKDLGAAAGHALEAGFLHEGHAFLVTDLGFLEDIVVLHRREGLDVEVRAVGADAAEEFGVEGYIVLRQDTADDVDLGDGLIVVAFDDVHDVVQGVLPAVFPLFDAAAVATESAGVEADVGRLHVKVPVEVGPVPVLLLPDVIGQGAEVTERCFVVEQLALIGGDPVAGNDLFRQRAQGGREGGVGQNGLDGGGLHTVLTFGQTFSFY